MIMKVMRARLLYESNGFLKGSGMLQEMSSIFDNMLATGISESVGV